MRRAVFTIVYILALMAPIALAPSDASAGKGWCRSDPVITTGGNSYALIGAAATKLDSAVYEITAPESVTVNWEYLGLANNESTVVIVGPVLSFRLLTTAATNVPIEFYVAKRFGGVAMVSGAANTPLTIPGW